MAYDDAEMITATVIADSISPDGNRLTSVECTAPRFVLPQITRHRVFSFSVQSSRAVSTKKLIEQVRTNPAMPTEWGREVRGMVADGLVFGLGPSMVWETAADRAADAAEALYEEGVHKQVVNRLLEPFLWCTWLMTGTEWQNFLAQRCHPHAQPETRRLAEKIRDAMSASDPRLLSYGSYFWHTPYVTEDEEIFGAWDASPLHVSAARCARVSYNPTKAHTIAEDLELYRKLISADPPHLGPLEHVASPESGYSKGNLTGWWQLRHSNEV